MAVFEYKALNANGKSVKGVIDAESERTARQRLKGQGIFPTSVAETRSKQTRGIQFSAARKVSSGQLGLLTRQLGTLLNAGMPLVESLRALGKQIESPRLKKVVSEVRDSVNEGKTLAASMGDYPKVFPELYVNMIAAGEASGSLDIVLNRLADLLESQAGLKRKVYSALTYPILMMVLCVGVIALLLAVVVPQIVTIFEENNATLPLPTQIVIALSDFTQSIAGLFLLVFFAVAVITGRKYVQTEKGKEKFHRLLLRMPLVGKLTLKVAAARLSRNLGAMLASGVPLLQALKIVRAIIGNVILRRALESAANGVQEGKSLAKELQATGHFPTMLIHMVGVGEKSGDLEGMLSKAATTYESEVDAIVTGLSSILEPILIIFLAVIVGGILGSVMLPMLEMSKLTGLG